MFPIRELAKRLRRNAEYQRGNAQYCIPINRDDRRCEDYATKAEDLDRAAERVEAVAAELGNRSDGSGGVG